MYNFRVTPGNPNSNHPVFSEKHVYIYIYIYIYSTRRIHIETSGRMLAKAPQIGVTSFKGTEVLKY